MNTAMAIDRQINTYLGKLNSRQKKAVLTVVKTLAEEQEEHSLLAIPEAHQKLVRQRIKHYSQHPEQLLDWGKAQKSVKGV